MSATLHIGLVVNPLAGLGGSLGLKGSDGQALRDRLAGLTAGQRHRALDRVERALRPLARAAAAVNFSTWGGDMGEEALAGLGLPYSVLGQVAGGTSAAADTRDAVVALREAGVDLILFAGGDGTARDIFDVVGSSLPVLGIPAGVKMHSGVFAVSPEAAGELLLQLVRGGLVGLTAREVRDIDEEAFRHDRVRSRFYGEMLVPGEGRYLQHTKVGGRESPELVADDIADWLVEHMEPGRTYLVGPGSTTAAIMAKLGLPNTLLGVDAVRDGELLASDADEARLLDVIATAPGGAAIVVTVIGGQGHIFGRGNQQFSPRVIRGVGLDNIIVVAAKSKVAALEGRPLLVDTNDPDLDRELCGWHTVITGYDDKILYRVATIE
ncbi:MAG: ATP-NAD kinase family protein [Gammaproteobacteria bacterium]|nr:ATP-NAD kinase family protein [Gammaproteobacteria bacterium]